MRHDYANLFDSGGPRRYLATGRRIAVHAYRPATRHWRDLDYVEQATTQSFPV